MDLTVEDTAAGSQIKCPTCNTLLVVPAVSAEAPSGEESASKTFSGASDEQLARKIAAVYRQMAAEVGKAIVGQHEVIEQLFIAIFARSHCLLEGVPGLAKTYTIKSLSEAMSLSFRQVQFTPDLMPADITGTDVIQQDAEGRRQLVFLRGPIFAQLVLADEISRSPQRPKPPCWKPCRSIRSPSAARLMVWRNRSLCWLRKTPWNRKAPISCPRRRRTVSCFT